MTCKETEKLHDISRRLDSLKISADVLKKFDEVIKGANTLLANREEI